jgi:hypothetical protein
MERCTYRQKGKQTDEQIDRQTILLTDRWFGGYREKEHDRITVKQIKQNIYIFILSNILINNIKRN